MVKAWPSIFESRRSKKLFCSSRCIFNPGKVLHSSRNESYVKTEMKGYKKKQNRRCNNSATQLYFIHFIASIFHDGFSHGGHISIMRPELLAFGHSARISVTNLQYFKHIEMAR
jgi:hypothetical protein